MKITVMIVLGYLWGAAALATVKPEPPPEKQTQTQAQQQAQKQQQSQGQSQRAQADAHAAAHAAATSNSGGNTQSTHIVTRESAAALAQGSLVLGDCGFASNAGGSGRGGAGFLGLVFQTPQCNDFKLAGYYFTIGDYATGCAIIAQTPAGKRQAKRGITLPQCINPPLETPAPPAPQTVVIEKPADCPACPDCDKAFKQCVAK